MRRSHIALLLILLVLCAAALWYIGMKYMDQENSTKGITCLETFVTPVEQEEKTEYEERLADRTLFSALATVDATKFGDTAVQILGTVTKEGIASLGNRELLRTLIGAEIITTYWHIGAELCLFEEDNTDARYRAHIRGTHEYFTSERNVDTYTFWFEIDKESGEMRIRSDE